MITERQETNEVSPMTAPALPAWFPDWGGAGGERHPGGVQEFPSVGGKSWEPRNVKVAIVHEAEYLREESCKEIEFWRSIIFNSWV